MHWHRRALRAARGGDVGPSWVSAGGSAPFPRSGHSLIPLGNRLVVLGWTYQPASFLGMPSGPLNRSWYVRTTIKIIIVITIIITITLT